MDHPNTRDLAGTIGTDASRSTLLDEIVGKVAGLDIVGSDDDLDRWWGMVEADRLASGLTLATINRLAEPNSTDEPAGPWVQKADEDGDEVTRLTPEGRRALRRMHGTQART